MKKQNNNQGKKRIGCRALMSCTQILILIGSMFAFSYMIYSLENNSVSAQETENYVCCEETKSGQSCQFIPESECEADSQKSPNECKNTVFCKSGCCFSENNGLCNLNTPKENCEDKKGVWFDDASCNIKQCERGCCILGSEGIWTTEKNCEIESGFYGLPMNFRVDVNSEISCIFLTEKDDEGACVFYSESIAETNCIYTTRENCLTKNGNDFYANYFCSDVELNTTCKSHAKTGCVEGKEEVYWFDSCGNREEVKEECSIFSGSICGQYRPEIDKKPNEGDYVCRDLSCDVEVYGKKVHYENGESWCEYEGTIGNGKDVVGSRHMRHICYLGEEKIEPCSDYRNQICVQSDSKLADGSDFSEASCRVNRWRSCYEYNNEREGMAEKCEENPDCYVHKVSISDNFNFDICVPNYPPGFDLKDENSMRNGEIECSLASQKCTVVYVKRFTGWKCESNCECEELGFVQQMNDLCTSLGDCGGYVNWVGDYTDDGYTSNVGRIDGNQYKKLADDNPNQKPAEPGNFGFSQILGIPEGLGAPSDKEEGFSFTGLGMLGVTIMSGVTASLASIPVIGEIGAEVGAKFAGQTLAEIETDAIIKVMKSTGTSTMSISQGEQIAGKAAGQAFGNLLAAAGALLSVQSFLSVGFGMKESSTWIISGAFVTTMVILQLFNLLGPISIVLFLYSWIAGLGDVKEKIKTFNCYPWQAPTGGVNCDKCNAEDVICSEYKCESLGQTCEFINKGTEEEKCIDNSPNDVSSPRISPLVSAISEGYDYKEVQNNGFSVKKDSGDCIDEYTRVEYGIETDKPSQCRIGTSAMQTYDEMPEYFGGRNLYLTEHKNVLFMLSPEAFKNQYNLTDEQIKDLGSIDFYVRCKSINGIINTASYAIKSCVKPGPDLTAPRVEKILPENNYAAFGESEKEIEVWVNEPSQCKWSNEDKTYSEMENSMQCKNNLIDYGLYGWACDANLDVSVNNKFYIKCRDISDNQNIMTESYVYEVSLSASKLRIEDLRPENGKEIVSGVEPVSLEFRVKTAGGAEGGNAVCRWEGNGYSDRFIDTGGIYHNYKITSATAGNYNVKFICEDAAGNIAENSTSFKITIDTSGPIITRIYYDNSLKIWTNEQADCRYGFSNKINWENATPMGYGIEHSADWQLKTYYIQCEDEFGNKGRVSAVKAYSLV